MSFPLSANAEPSQLSGEDVPELATLHRLKTEVVLPLVINKNCGRSAESPISATCWRGRTAPPVAVSANSLAVERIADGLIGIPALAPINESVPCRQTQEIQLKLRQPDRRPPEVFYPRVIDASPRCISYPSRISLPTERTAFVSTA